MSQTLPTTISIKEVIDEAEGIRTFVFEHQLNAKAGQFVMLWIPRLDEKPFSVWAKEENEFRVTVSAVGPFSKKLYELKAEDKVGFRGPYGRNFSLPENKKILLIGGGFGTAPLLFLAAQAKNCEVDLIIGARNKDLIFGNKYVEKLGINLHIATNDGSVGEKGFNTELFEKLLKAKKISPDMVYSCGPELMMKRVAEICQENNLPCELSLERYMKCGFGVCGACTMDDDGFCVCKDGPIISGKKALKFTEFGNYHRDSVGDRENF